MSDGVREIRTEVNPWKPQRFFTRAWRRPCATTCAHWAASRSSASSSIPRRTSRRPRALADKLNAGRRERLSDEQERLLIRLAREKRGFSATLAYLCDETGFERPKAIAPADKAAQLMRDFNLHVEQLGRIQRAMVEAGLLPKIKAVA